METRKTQEEMTETARKIVDLLIGYSMPEVELTLSRANTIATNGSQVTSSGKSHFMSDAILPLSDKIQS